MTTADNVIGAPSAQAAPAQWSWRNAAPASGIWRTGIVAASAWLTLGVLTIAWPNREVGFSDWNFTRELGFVALAVAALLLVVALLGARAGRVGRTLRPAGQWLVAAPLLLALWETLTAKLGLLPPPFFAPPQSLIDVVHEDWARLGLSTAHSLRLLAHGFVLGLQSLVTSLEEVESFPENIIEPVGATGFGRAHCSPHHRHPSSFEKLHTECYRTVSRETTP